MEFLKNKLKNKERKYQRRKFKTNSQTKATNCGIRLLINRTNMYIWAQVLGTDGKVLLDMNDKKISGDTKSARAEALGVEVAKVLKEKGIEQITFDRNGFLYHGRVKSVAEGLRKGGIKL